MPKQKILITGGAGYIGAHTVLELHGCGYIPVVVDNFSKSDDTLLKGIEQLIQMPVRMYKGDCMCKDFLRDVFQREKTIVGVMHFAAYKSVRESLLEPLNYYENNVGSLLSLLRVMRDQQVFNLVFSSSCTVYGEPEHVPLDEDTPFHEASSPYGKTKQVCEQILVDFAYANPSMQIISLRYFNPIGAHPSALLGELPIDTPNNLVPYITQTAAGLYDKLTIFGDDYDTSDGTCIRDFIHVVDLANAHVKAIERNISKKDSAYAAYNIGTGKGISVMQLVKQFIEVTHVDLSYEIGPRRLGDISKIYANVDKAKKKLAWSARYTTKDALLHAWQWEAKIRKIDGPMRF